MSAGRRTVALSDLQGVAGAGFVTSVTKALLGEDTDTGTFRVVEHLVDVTEDAIASPELGWEAYRRPTDHFLRMTDDDIRREVVEAMEHRLPERLWQAARDIHHGHKPTDLTISLADLETIRTVQDAARREVLATVPRTPGAKRKPKTNHRPRYEAPCSPVRVTTADGRKFVDGQEVEDWWPEDFEPVAD